ncbi:MAG TPA: hypothetical protein VFT98_19255, partial [Myxococcota bacterium]|nr:hypothetical protein [Myxococcota bacterium]
TTDRLGARVHLWLRLVAATLVVAGVHFAGVSLRALPARGDAEIFVPSPQTARLLSFGFDAALSDFHWMRAIQIVGSPEGPAGRSHVLAALIDLVTTLDPWVDHPYRFAAVWINDDEPAVRKANRLIRRGIDHHPNDWRGYFYLAFNHFYYLGEQEEAARALEPALELEGRPIYLTRLHARLAAQAGGLDAAAAFLAEMAQQTTDAIERKKFEEALMEVETERRARFLDAARAEYVRRYARDIESVDDLVSGGVLRALPPDPFGKGWMLGETAQIVSKHVRYRYGVKLDGGSREIIRRFRERSRAN